MGFLPEAVMLNMSQLHPQNEDNKEGTPGNGTTSVLMKELLSPETQLCTRTFQSCKSRGTQKRAAHVHSAAGLGYCQSLAKRNHLTLGSEQTSSSLSTQ